jgi:putative transposase
MPEYRRYYQPGGTYFFTLVTAGRKPLLSDSVACDRLREVVRLTQERWPFEVEALVVLPDHLHTIWRLPDGDYEFSKRIGFLKKEFTKGWLTTGKGESWVSPSKRKDRRKGVWQRRFMEHLVRDDADFERHCDYTYYNPVRHGLVGCPHKWRESTFDEAVGKGQYDRDWLCTCGARRVKPPDFGKLTVSSME